MIRFDVRHRQGDFRLEGRFDSSAGVTALFGRSGSGKSTIIELIAGLRRPAAGRIEVDGTVLVDTAAGVFLPPHRRRIGLVHQDALLFQHLNVRHNLVFGRWFLPRAARRVPFDAVVETLGLAALLGRRPASLSGGERQRVAIGRALIASPRLLLMDEPLAALDRARKLEILPLIERLRDDFAIPIVYVSHAVEEIARLAGTVVAVDAGRIGAVGAPETVLGPGDGADRFAVASVLTATVAAHDPGYGLTRLDHPAGAIFLAGRAGETGRPLRVVVRATDVTLAAAPPRRTTVRTVLAGRIAAIRAGDGPTALVDVALPGGGRLAASVTRMGLADLACGIGDPVHALVKTVALDEQPMGG